MRTTLRKHLVLVFAALNCLAFPLLAAQNKAPVADNDSYNIDANSGFAVLAPGVLANDTDQNGDSLTAVLIGNVSHGALQLGANGSFSYVPSANFNGTDSFVYKANDGQALSGLATVTITVDPPANHPPVVNAVTGFNTSVNQPIGITLSFLAVDQDGDPLTFRIIQLPNNGTLTQSGTGGVIATYSPSSNFAGDDSFTYVANDGKADSNVGTVTINVTPPVNHPPVANNDSFGVNANTASIVTAPGVLGNDTDQDGNPLTAVLVNSVSHGTLQLNANGSFTYLPASNFNGTDSFVYQANDGQALSGPATVTIAVTPPVNHPPVVSGITSVGPTNTVSTFVFFASDLDGDPLTFRIIQLPSHGTLSGTLPNVTYTPNLNFVGQDSFTFVANDGKTDSNVGTVSITIRPVISINNVSVAEGNSVGGVAIFTATLTPPSTQIVSVRWTTEDGYALASSGYTAASGTLIFSPGVTQQTIIVSIVRDSSFELNETFRVRFLSLTLTNAIIQSGAGIGTCTILNDDSFKIGVTEGIPPEALVKVGERFTYGIKWTHPVKWRLLDTVDIRIIDDQDSILNVRFTEADNTFRLFHPANGKFLHSDAPGSRTHFETFAAVMYLEDSQVIGSGPDGPSVLLNLNLSFKPKAAGRIFRVEAFATDDDGNQQGFDEAGIIGVLRK